MDILNLERIPRADREKPLEESFRDVLEELETTRALCRVLDQIIENNPDGIYVTDGDANAIRINPAFERISGLRRSEMLGVNHRDLEKNHVVSRSSALMAIAQRRTVTIIHEYLPTQKQALVTSTPVFNADGEIDLVVSSTRDVTALSDLETRLAAEQASRQKYERQVEMIQQQLLDNRDMVAEDKKSLNILSTARRVASVDSSVLITGETGVGKDEVAKYIHTHSSRKKGPFITLNCGAIPENLVESELFGYERGAFTGARKEGKMGLLEVADQGTVFLDEVGELPLDVQVKLLRALETRTITRVGGNKPITIDVRILSATNCNLEEMVRERRFREDLYYRLRVIPIHIPPLRERPDDILPMVSRFLDSINEKYHMKKVLSRMAYRVLLQYKWPGNVREVKNVIERVAVMSDSDTITAEELPMYHDNLWDTHMMDADMPLKERLERIEYYYITEAYDRFKSVRKAAAALQMSMPTFVRKRQAYQEKYADGQ